MSSERSHASTRATHHRHQKQGDHGGHHGGAWKVAYADFVTAMMALFIVLWLLNSSQQIKEAVGGCFKDPTGTAKQVGSDMVRTGENFIVTKDNMQELMRKLPELPVPQTSESPEGSAPAPGGKAEGQESKPGEAKPAEAKGSTH